LKRQKPSAVTLQRLEQLKLCARSRDTAPRLNDGQGVRGSHFAVKLARQRSPRQTLGVLVEVGRLHSSRPLRKYIAPDSGKRPAVQAVVRHRMERRSWERTRGSDVMSHHIDRGCRCEISLQISQHLAERSE
jgi:hypothetical protein